MVHGIVTLLDLPHFVAVEELWREFERRFNVSWVSRRVPFPHLSYHVAASYRLPEVEMALGSLAAEFSPFNTKVAGLVTFTGGYPVLALNVVRTQELDRLHQRVWDAVADLSDGALDYYRPENWAPHITLAQGDLDGVNLPRLMSALLERRLDWEIMVENVTLMIDDGIKHDIRQRIAIGMER